MEESEKRRERLKAMRLQADQATASNGPGNPLEVSPGLTNPLIESSTSQSMQSKSYAAPRFDYYTDPMSAFNANKRRSKVSHHVQQDYHTPPRPINDATPPPAYGASTNFSDQRMFQAQRVYQGSPIGSPLQRASQFVTQGNCPGAFSGSNAYSPDQRMFQMQGVYPSSSPQQSPTQTASPFGTPQVNSPGVISGSTGPSNYCFPSNLSRGGSSPGPRFGQGRWQRCTPVPGYGGSPYPNTGRGSPYPNTGRGSPYSNTGGGRTHHMSPGSSQSRGRSSSHSSVSAEFRPDLFYDRSMIEDPWQQLKPVIWRRPGPTNSWIPISTQTKKARVEEDRKKLTSERSLAEYLAASFDEAAESEATDSKYDI